MCIRDRDGSVAVAGLHGHDGIDVDYAEADLRRDSGVLPSTALIGTGSLASRLWTRPAVTVIGLDVPAVDDSSNTLQDALRAKLSIRLAPGDTPESALRAVKEHLRAHVPFGARIELGAEESGSPWQADLDDPVTAIAHGALSDGFGACLLYTSPSPRDS